MRVLLHVEPGPDERDHVVAWAADLVEAITADLDDTGLGPAVEVGVVANILDCLEIGIVTLGRAAPHTVENLERRIAPVTLFLFGPPGEADELTAEQARAYECIRELAASGAVEEITGEGSGLVHPFPDADDTLPVALGRREWESVVVLGGSASSRARIEEWSREHRRVPVVRPDPPDKIRERVDSLLRRLQPEFEDIYGHERRLAVQRAVQLGMMLEQLGLGSELVA